MIFLLQSLNRAIENLRRNKLVNILCLGIVSFSLLVLGIFYFVSFTLEQKVGKIGNAIEAIFYFRDNASAPDIENLLNRLNESPLVKKIRAVSQDEAETNFLREFPELRYILEEFPASPFPASLEVQFRNEPALEVAIEAFINDIGKQPLIESVQLNIDWAKKIALIKRFIAVVGYFLGLILLLVSMFIIFNVIKLNIFYRREEIEILRLVGATAAYIHIPFLIEGGMMGLCGGLLGCLFLGLLIKLFALYGATFFGIAQQVLRLPHPPFQLWSNLILLGTSMGLLSALLSLKRFIRFTPQKP